MTNVLTFARQSLSDALSDGAGLRVVPEVPATYSPPLCWVVGRAPYRTQGQTIGAKDVYLSVVCIAAAGTNSASQEAVDNLGCEVADFVMGLDGFSLDPEEEIGPPQLYGSAQSQSFLGVTVNVIATVARAEQ